MNTQTQSRRQSTGLVLASVAIMAAGTLLGFYLGGAGSNQPTANELDMAPIRLAADSAARGKGVSMATGLINEEFEGLFILDHLSGELQCWLLNPRSGQVGGIYRADVAEALGTDATDKGEPDYVMTTGRFFINANRTGNMVPADSVLYVADGNTGKVIGYNVRFNKAGLQRGAVQEGTLTVVCTGSVRNVLTRQ